MTIQERDTPGFSSDECPASLRLSLPDAFSYRETLHYLSRSPLECMHRMDGDKVYKLLELEHEPALIEISRMDGASLRIRYVDGQSRSDEAQQATANYVREWWDLRTNLAPFYRMAEADPLLGGLTREYYGLRIMGVPSLFEALCWAVIGQQVNLPFAYTLKKRLVEAFGKRILWNDQSFWLFPKPQDVAAVSVEALMKLQFTGRKAEYVIGIAQLMLHGELSKQALREANDFAAAEQRLLAIRGIGPWTANYVLMRCLRYPCAFPVGDAGLHNALKALLKLRRKPTEHEIRELFAPWRGWEAYAVFYLWRSLAPIV